MWRRGRTAPDAAGFGECGVGISYISSHLGPVAAPATRSYLCAHTIIHYSAGVALPTSAAPRFAYQMPLLFDSLVYPAVCISSMHVTGMSTSQIVLALMMLRSLLMPARTNVKHAKPLLV